ncbi:nickel pincer cofactor biosynthesis protein LarC [candidate division KSB1 bacterium]
MKAAYFDCFAGVSGDMILGALIDLGLIVEELDELLRSVGLDSFELKAERTNKKGFNSINFTVTVEHSHHHRKLNDILSIVDKSELSDTAKKSITKIFTRIAEIEGGIHQRPKEDVHFHEVGSMDSMIDIFGTVWGIEKLGIEKLYCSAITMGSGSVKCEHGIIPVPSPASLGLAEGFPVQKKEVGFELATPTGVALVTSLAEFVDLLPEMKITGTGYGCGDRDIEDFPNVLRIITGETAKTLEEDNKLIIETNIDDMNPEILPYVIERLLNDGAVDAFLTPILMKKGRPGYKLSVITDRSFSDRCLRTIFSETSSIGVRMYETSRKKLKRESENVKTEFGDIKVKSYVFENDKYIAPEYEECKKIALKENIPLQKVYDMIKRSGKTDDKM